MRHLFTATILLLLTACAPTEQDYTPVTRSPELTPQVFDPGSRKPLPLRSWRPEGKPRAVIIALHGFNDYSQAFDIPGTILRPQGIATFAYDQRGFGLSEPQGVWGGIPNFTEDLKQAVVALRAEYPHTPLYILGESMGGAVASLALSQPDFPRVDGVILVAPAVWGKDTMNVFWRGALWALAHTIPGHEMTGSDLKILATDNLALLRVMVHDPLVIKKTRVDAVYGIVALMNEGAAAMEDIKAPVLLLYGAKDQVIPPDPIRTAIGRLPDSARVAVYPDGYHMLLRDLGSDAPIGDIAGWIKNREKPLPSGYDKDARERLK